MQSNVASATGLRAIAISGGGLHVRPLDYVALAFISAFYLLYGIDSYGILNNNEGLYAELARELVEGGSAVVPTLNGVPYLEKPPLLSWILAAAYAAFGQSEAIARTIPVLAAGIIIAATVQLAYAEFDGFVAWLAGLVLATSICVVVIFRTLLPDGLLVLFFTLSMLFFLRWHRHGPGPNLAFSYACLAFAVLAKGLVALALGPAIFVAFAAATRRWWSLRHLLHVPAILVFLLIVAPWHIALAIQDPDLAWFYVVNEHILRFLDLREPRDYYTGPVYYYLPRTAMYLFPWSVFLPLLAWPRGAAPVTDVEKLAWAWFGVTLVFFSVSSAKANYYMVLGMPPLAVLLAVRLVDLLGQEKSRVVAMMTALLVFVGLLGLWSLHWSAFVDDPKGLWIAAAKLTGGLRWALIGFALVASLAAVSFALRRGRLGAYALAVSSVPLLIFFVSMMSRADPYVSERRLGQYLVARHSAEPVFVFQDYEKLASLPYYLKREVAIVDSRSNDLRFGMKHHENRSNFVAAEQFREAARNRRVVLLVHRNRLEAFQRTLGRAGLVQSAQVGNVRVYVN